MHRIFRVKAYEKEHGPHFNEEYARKAVMKMENEDGTRGPHWSLEETSALASQYGISLSGKFNRYDWFVALNMVYSDYYKALLNIASTILINKEKKPQLSVMRKWLNVSNYQINLKFIMSLLMKIQRQQSFKMK